MMKYFLRMLGILLSAAGLVYSGAQGCSSGKSGILKFPTIVAIDSPQSRVFVVDNQRNGLYLVDPISNSVVGGQALLENSDPQVLPDFPNNAAVASLGGGLSRLFVVGLNNGIPQNEIVSLDYNTTGLTLSSFSPITVTGQPSDLIVGLAVDMDDGLLFATNSSSGELHAYDLNSGVEAPGSPIALTGTPGNLSYDSASGRLAVSSFDTNEVTFFEASNLATPPETLDVGVFSRSVALVSNSNGSVLFLSGNQVNIAKVFKVDFTNLAASSEIFSLSPPPASGPIPNPNFLTGNLNQVAAANLSDGRVGGFFTQSTGDLLELDLSSDLNTLNPAVTLIGAISGEGIDTFLNSADQATEVYFASPGVGTLTIVDPLTNQFTKQVN